MQITIHKPYAFCETGKRENNEDCIFPEVGTADTNDNYFVVCDGLGGYNKGEIASSTVCGSFASILSHSAEFNESVFRQALMVAYDNLDALCRNNEIDKKTGTTLAFLYLSENGAYIAHIGDSRIYHFRKEEKRMRILYKSEDHSFVNDLVKSGMITPEEAENHPRKNIITQAIQPLQEKRCEADMYKTEDIKDGDIFFLCTDGVLEQMNDAKLSRIFSLDITPEEMGNRILTVCEKESRDNFSAYLIAVKHVSGNDAIPEIETQNNNTEKTRKNIGRKPKNKLSIILSLLCLLVCASIGIWFTVRDKPVVEPKGIEQNTADEKPEESVMDKKENTPVTEKEERIRESSPPKSFRQPDTRQTTRQITPGVVAPTRPENEQVRLDETRTDTSTIPIQHPEVKDSANNNPEVTEEETTPKEEQGNPSLPKQQGSDNAMEKQE